MAGIDFTFPLAEDPDFPHDWDIFDPALKEAFLTKFMAEEL